MKHRHLVLAVLSSALIVAACGDGDDDGSGAPATTTDPVVSNLTGRTFLSTNVSGRDLVADTRLRLSFAAEGISVHAGCNSMGGGWSVEDGRLQVGQLFTTEMACDPARMDQDMWLAEFLQAGPALTLEGDQLVLDHAGVRVELLDRRVADPDRPLIGTRWEVDTLLSNQAASTTPLGTTASLTFAEDGRVAVEAGCNTGSAAYTPGQDGTVTLGPLALTKMLCEPGAMELEAAVTAVFDQEVAIEIEADRLSIRAGEVGLGLRASG